MGVPVVSQTLVFQRWLAALLTLEVALKTVCASSSTTRHQLTR